MLMCSMRYARNVDNTAIPILSSPTSPTASLFSCSHTTQASPPLTSGHLWSPSVLFSLCPQQNPSLCPHCPSALLTHLIPFGICLSLVTTKVDRDIALELSTLWPLRVSLEDVMCDGVLCTIESLTVLKIPVGLTLALAGYIVTWHYWSELSSAEILLRGAQMNLDPKMSLWKGCLKEGFSVVKSLSGSPWLDSCSLLSALLPIQSSECAVTLLGSYTSGGLETCGNISSPDDLGR